MSIKKMILSMLLMVLLPSVFLYGSYRTLFDNFEDGDARNSFYGPWYTYDDRNDTGSGNPHAIITPYPFYVTTGGFNNSFHCAYIYFDLTPSLFKDKFAALASNILDDAVNPYADFSQYTGIGFWFKVSSSVGMIQMRFGYNNYPGLPEEKEMGGITPRGYNLYGVTTDWRFYVVAFTNFKVPEWIAGNTNFDGRDNETGEVLFDPYATKDKWDKIRTITFYCGSPMTKGKFWVDDISLVSAPLYELNRDNDNDGYNNYIEYAAGTDINDAGIYPEESILKDANQNGIFDKNEKRFITDVSVNPDPMSVGTGTDITITIYRTSEGEKVELNCEIFNSSGDRMIKKIFSLFSSDTFIYYWNGYDKNNKKVKPGLYLICIKMKCKNEEDIYYRAVIVK